MDKTLLKEKDEFEFRRKKNMSSNIRKESKKWQKEVIKCDKMFQALKILLSEEQIKLVIEYSEQAIYLTELEMDIAYKQGFKDGFNIAVHLIR